MKPLHLPLHLFDGTGLELEYMIVDRDTLAVRPIADELLAAVCGSYAMEVELGPVAWSNELALHVIEMKTNGPSPTLAGLSAMFQGNVTRMNELLAPMGARLMPTAMHPFMDPHTEVRLWPHEDSSIYDAFDRIFDCRGHGWGNLQSTHINLPFTGDDELGRLHAAVRLVLPILPALAASSPIADGRRTGLLDTRVDVYRDNARRVPSVTGLVVPEPVFSRADYEGVLLQGIYDDLAPLDPDGILREEWVNARGCIARFDRGSIEIRLLDIQECPLADMAIAAAVIAVVRALVDERFASYARQREWCEGPLARLLLDATARADGAVVRDGAYLRDLGYPEQGPCTMRELWQHLVETTVAREPGYAEWAPWYEVMWREGCLARRILGALEGAAAGARDVLPPEALRAVYGRLCDSLAAGAVFRAGA